MKRTGHHHRETQAETQQGIPLYVADVAIDLGIFKALADKKDSGFSAHELAKHLGREELLVCKSLRNEDLLPQLMR